MFSMSKFLLFAFLVCYSTAGFWSAAYIGLAIAGAIRIHWLFILLLLPAALTLTFRCIDLNQCREITVVLENKEAYVLPEHHDIEACADSKANSWSDIQPVSECATQPSHTQSSWIPQRPEEAHVATPNRAQVNMPVAMPSPAVRSTDSREFSPGYAI